jgi:hypothetical protein
LGSNRVENSSEQQDIESAEIEPVNLSMAVLKEAGAKWIVEMAEYIDSNPQFITSGFRKAGIASALDNQDSSSESKESNSESESEEQQ